MSVIHKTIFKWLYRLVGLVFLTVACLGVFAWYLFSLPYQQPGIVLLDTYVEVPNGSSATKTSRLLEDAGVIRSADVFLLSLKVAGKSGDIKSGSYYFDKPQTLEEVIGRVTSSNYGLPTKTVTLFEGEPNFKYAERLAKEFEYITESEFMALAQKKEGYLFPDTYNIPLRATSQDVIKKLQKNFEKRTESLAREIADSTYSLDEIVTMASLIETEAGSASYETKQKVSGVLWRRIEINMPLQADAVFSYIYKKHLPLVLFKHLEVDSPYNVYKNTGLPPGPIANPGFDSIRAALNPNDTGNLFYITGNDGIFYYAKTFAGHNANIRKHLR